MSDGGDVGKTRCNDDSSQNVAVFALFPVGFVVTTALAAVEQQTTANNAHTKCRVIFRMGWNDAF